MYRRNEHIVVRTMWLFHTSTLISVDLRKVKNKKKSCFNEQPKANEHTNKNMSHK